MILRFDVQQAANQWQMRITSPDSPAWMLVERKGTVDANGYPVPPQDESGRWQEPWQPLCQDLDAAAQLREAAHQLFLKGDPRTGYNDVEALGGYLSAVLLGSAWTAISGIARNEAVRLQLSLPVEPEAPHAPRPLWPELPWELMVDADGPLTAFGKTVSISRVLQSKGTPNGTVSIQIPIRVLFVVGRELDSQLRPGAEYLSLLSQMQCTIGPEQDARGVALHTRLLMEATTEDVQTALDEFKPAVVHLISHGQISGQGSTVILTKYATQERRNPQPNPVNAQRLATLLRASDEQARPVAVVLNACNTARIGDTHASFAGDLVRYGIPLVVGMAGETADAACRLFARQFYSALIEKRPVDVAAGEGRRAALLHFKNFTQHFDWGRAVFCQAEGVTTKFDLQPQPKAMIKVAQQLRPKQRREPFCGRLQWLLRFRELFDQRIPNLAIESTEEAAAGREDRSMMESEARPQIGMSRLLEELTWLSVLEGWVPIRIDQNRNGRYSNLMHWAVQVFTLAENLREKFGVARANQSELVDEAAFTTLEIPKQTARGVAFLTIRDQVLAKLEPQQRITSTNDTILQLLRADLEQLRADVQHVVGPRKGVLLLWDQLDYEEAIAEDVIRLLEENGLGTKACPIPMVFTYARRSSGGKKLLVAINGNSNIDPRSLLRYDSLENAMACRQFLAWQKFVPSPLKRQQFADTMAAFEGQVAGYPSNLFTFAQGLSVLTAAQIIVPFDDVQIMNQFAVK
jgi:hypothetical protein